MYKQFFKYVKACRIQGCILENVKSLVAHFLHGTDPVHLARASKRGIVPNPPGH